MGIKIKDITEPKKIEISELSNKILAVDTFNILYQFITTIRQPDGTPLQDKNGNVTSHLIGLFSRTTKLMLNKIKLPPALPLFSQELIDEVDSFWKRYPGGFESEKAKTSSSTPELLNSSTPELYRLFLSEEAIGPGRQPAFQDKTFFIPVGKCDAKRFVGPVAHMTKQDNLFIPREFVYAAP